AHPYLHSFPTRRSSDLRFSTSAPAMASDCLFDLGRMLGQVLLDLLVGEIEVAQDTLVEGLSLRSIVPLAAQEQRLEHGGRRLKRSEEHTSELQSLAYLV